MATSQSYTSRQTKGVIVAFLMLVCLFILYWNFP